MSRFLRRCTAGVLTVAVLTSFMISRANAAPETAFRDNAQWVAAEEWHPQQKGRWLDDDRYELQVPYSDPTELVMDVLRHGDSVVVEGDKALAATLARKLRSAAARYAG